ncbi:uncharacterized protein CCOS01_08553 [Colletotrichum costaricense]|uniref:Uncharacterized protein n=1 Tax=Colletotrichum costaricense TaxID=1209916 RepID=A0AAJ0DZK6_9PEZI|nr:uncharacterized protein CCOS01_08553 [Colletotrichum costaricense]KAK1526135.1 hypothetical protein CCOS01_08553 [Colletotrichum costaricense]
MPISGGFGPSDEAVKRIDSARTALFSVLLGAVGSVSAFSKCFALYQTFEVCWPAAVLAEKRRSGESKETSVMGGG